MNLPVLIVLHQEHSTPGRIGNALQQPRLSARHPPAALRRSAAARRWTSHAGAVIFGGPQSANDEDDFVRREIDWLKVPLKENKPFLGICLGAQMLARQLGAKVYTHPEGHAEVGYYPIRPTAAGRAVCEDWPDHVYQWHREGFDLPPAPRCWRRATPFRCRPSATAARPSRCNSTWTSPTP